MTAENRRLVSVTASERHPERAAHVRRPCRARRRQHHRRPSRARQDPRGEGLCARGTRGKLDGDLQDQCVDALYISAEDSIEHTLVPRAIAAGADLKRLHFFRAVNVNSYHGDEENPGISIPDDIPAARQLARPAPQRADRDP